MHRCMVCSKAVLVVAIVHGDLDADTSINETNNCRRNANEVGIPSISSARKSNVQC